jgi:hypothetical protein
LAKEDRKKSTIKEDGVLGQLGKNEFVKSLIRFRSNRYIEDKIKQSVEILLTRKLLISELNHIGTIHIYKLLNNPSFKNENTLSSHAESTFIAVIPTDKGLFIANWCGSLANEGNEEDKPQLLTRSSIVTAKLGVTSAG